MKKVTISARKLESYKRAEEVCRELRYQWSHAQNKDNDRLFSVLMKWMNKTGKIKYDRP